VLCSKVEERPQWEAWAKEAGRTDDLIIFDASAKWRFNFLDWEATRSGEGGGFTINIVAMLASPLSLKASCFAAPAARPDYQDRYGSRTCTG
jgi:hypothetical protein